MLNLDTARAFQRWLHTISHMWLTVKNLLVSHNQRLSVHRTTVPKPMCLVPGTLLSEVAPRFSQMWSPNKFSFPFTWLHMLHAQHDHHSLNAFQLLGRYGARGISHVILWGTLVHASPPAARKWAFFCIMQEGAPPLSILLLSSPVCSQAQRPQGQRGLRGQKCPNFASLVTHKGKKPTLSTSKNVSPSPGSLPIFLSCLISRSPGKDVCARLAIQKLVNNAEQPQPPWAEKWRSVAH